MNSVLAWVNSAWLVWIAMALALAIVVAVVSVSKVRAKARDRIPQYRRQRS